MPITASALCSSSAARTALRSILALCLAACGGGGGGAGGGGGDLTVDFSYPQTATYLWQNASLTYQASGLEGHAPTCAVVAGNLPAGLSLSGCTVTGTPTQAGESAATIRLTVPGYSGQVDKAFTFQVIGPASTYAMASTLRRGTPISVQPMGSITPPWSPQAGQSVVYSVAAGSLPDGLTLNPATGAIGGIVTRTNAYTFRIAVTATGPLGASTQTTQNIFCNVVLEGLQFFYGPNDMPVQSQAGTTLSLVPLMNFGQYLDPANYTFSNYRLAPSSDPLPQGMALDAGTGLLSGVPAAAGHSVIVIQADIAASGQSAVYTTSPLDLTVTP